MAPTQDQLDKKAEQMANIRYRSAQKSLTLKKAIAYVAVVIIVVTICGSIIYVLPFIF